jgi:hypothetical protein
MPLVCLRSATYGQVTDNASCGEHDVTPVSALALTGFTWIRFLFDKLNLTSTAIFQLSG